jgi:hypothetical protein
MLSAVFCRKEIENWSSGQPRKDHKGLNCVAAGYAPMGQGHAFSGADVSKHIGGALADGMNSGVGSAFNRSGIFSVTECNTLIQWVEAERIAKWEKIEEHGRWKHHQLVASPTTTKPALIRVERKLCEFMAELNNEIWRFHITSFGPLVLHRYESGDRVGLHVDLVTDYCDRKLAAIVQLSAPDAYRGVECAPGAGQVEVSDLTG